MTTVDQLLTQIVNYSSPAIEDYFPNRDARVLRSMSTAISHPNFITENQSKLVLKILKENLNKIPVFKDDIETSLSAPIWSKPFRQITAVRKMYISTLNSPEAFITIEFTFSSPIRKLLTNLSKKITGLNMTNNGKVFNADLTEQNIVRLVDALTPYDFVIDEKITNFYNTIKSWSENEVKNQFLLTTITHTNFHKQITADLGIETAIDENIIKDRSLRYQYFVEKTEKNQENLVEYIANRKTSKIWIDKKTASLEKIIASLISLKRLPTLLIFDSYNTEKCLEELVNLNTSLEKNGIFENIGIYFRLDNTPIGKEFNQLISDKKYNAQLDSSTKIVGIQSGKIPKFLLKTDWKPMSVISIGKALQNNKTSVYVNCCDLNITWAEHEPILFTVNI
jgi:hypothetical protein